MEPLNDDFKMCYIAYVKWKMVLLVSSFHRIYMQLHIQKYHMQQLWRCLTNPNASVIEPKKCVTFVASLRRCYRCIQRVHKLQWNLITTHFIVCVFY